MVSFTDVEKFIRRHQRIPDDEPITPDTQFERDLGITGDDGAELLEDIEVQFDVSFDSAEHSWRDVFGLEHDEFLFNGEPTIWPFSIFNRSFVRRFSVGELHQALAKLQAEKEASNRL